MRAWAGYSEWGCLLCLAVIAGACGSTAANTPFSNESSGSGGNQHSGSSHGSSGGSNGSGGSGDTTVSGSGGMSGFDNSSSGSVGSTSGTTPGTGSGIASTGSGSLGDAGPGMVQSSGMIASGPPAQQGCGGTMPAMSDYSKNGPFQTMTMDGSGPDGKYTVYQPTPLGQNGFKHPIVMWGNGITTTPQYYPTLLSAVASNGFVVIASDSTSVTPQLMTAGLDWMIMQNSASGQYQGKLNTTCLVAMGYSLGGGGAVSAGSHANVVTTVSFHGVTGLSGALKSPLLLFTSETDNFVTASGFVTPTFQMSAVQTFYATLTKAGDPSNLGHLLPVDLLDPNDPERPPAIAWIRYWVYGDMGGAHYFWGGMSATLCQAPWTCQTKNWH